MVEAAQPRSSLEAVMRAVHVGDPPASAGFTIQERRPLTIVQIAEFPQFAGPRSEIETALAMALPPARKSITRGERSVLWVGPGRWFVVEPRCDDLAAALDRVARGAFAVTDLSHARTVLRLSGAKVVDVLCQGCAVDLHPRALAVGDSFVAGVARRPALLHVVDAQPVFDLYVYRSFAQDMFEWLTSAADEVRVLAPPMSPRGT